MKIKINSLWNSPIGTNQDFDLSPTEIELFEDKKATFSGKISLTKLEDSVLGKISGEATTDIPCDRCLTEITLNSPISLGIEFTPKATDEENVWPIDKHWQIDLTEPIRQEAVASLPSPLLCSEACKGLCQSCGKNLNDNTCECGKVDYEVSNKIDLPH
ncbi:MAG: DUF177 domain-containing protein [Patescibacteria group bacterium]|nr:DUF177 domain-containing protein [Patescibacteria group bacterium]